jgi:predicted metallo-beta-lactamase superfamily hydrolase
MSEGVRIAAVAVTFSVIACLASAIYVAPQNRQAAALSRIADSIDNVAHAIRVQTKDHYLMYDNYTRLKKMSCERCGSGKREADDE